jgi:hypothetical protein
MLNFALKWVATVVTLAGALLTSLDIHPINLYVLNIGTVIWLIWAIRVKETSLIVVDIGLLAIYVLGLFI